MKIEITGPQKLFYSPAGTGFFFSFWLGCVGLEKGFLGRTTGSKTRRFRAVGWALDA